MTDAPATLVQPIPATDQPDAAPVYHYPTIFLADDQVGTNHSFIVLVHDTGDGQWTWTHYDMGSLFLCGVFIVLLFAGLITAWKHK